MLNLRHAPLDKKVTDLLQVVMAWAKSRPEISAIALAGSHAHGDARPDSDIDLVILSDSPDELRSSHWLSVLGDCSDVSTEQWGVATCHRARYAIHGEVEVGVVPSGWADIPVDPGTYTVVHDGIIPVHDPRGLLKTLVEEVQKNADKENKHAMIIRPATTQDARHIAEVHVAGWKTTYAGQMPQSLLDGLSVSQRESLWKRLLTDPSHRTFVAENEAGVVGFSNCGPSRDKDGGSKVGELYAIYLVEKLKGNGFGKALWERAYRSMIDIGYTDITLWVLDTNLRARGFYEKMGFTLDGAEKREHFGDKELNELRYRLRVE